MQQFLSPARRPLYVVIDQAVFCANSAAVAQERREELQHPWSAREALEKRGDFWIRPHSTVSLIEVRSDHLLRAGAAKGLVTLVAAAGLLPR